MSHRDADVEQRSAEWDAGERGVTVVQASSSFQTFDLFPYCAWNTDQPVFWLLLNA